MKRASGLEIIHGSKSWPCGGFSSHEEEEEEEGGEGEGEDLNLESL
jgi:hypothetical protein